VIRSYPRSGLLWQGVAHGRLASVLFHACAQILEAGTWQINSVAVAEPQRGRAARPEARRGRRPPMRGGGGGAPRSRSPTAAAGRRAPALLPAPSGFRMGAASSGTCSRRRPATRPSCSSTGVRPARSCLAHAPRSHDAHRRRALRSGDSRIRAARSRADRASRLTVPMPSWPRALSPQQETAPASSAPGERGRLPRWLRRTRSRGILVGVSSPGRRTVAELTERVVAPAVRAHRGDRAAVGCSRTRSPAWCPGRRSSSVRWRSVVVSVAELTVAVVCPQQKRRPHRPRLQVCAPPPVTWSIVALTRTGSSAGWTRLLPIWPSVFNPPGRWTPEPAFDRHGVIAAGADMVRGGDASCRP